MFLNGKTGLAHLNHPLKNMDLPVRLSDDRLAVLVAALKNRTIDQSGREELARGHVRLALHVVRRYLTRAPHKRDDLVAEAMYGIAYAMDKAPERLKDNNFTGYCNCCIHRFVVRELIEGHEGAMSHSQYSRLKKLGKTPTDVKMEPLTDDHVVPDPISLFDLEEAVEHSIHNDLERTVIDLRRQGFTDYQIGTQLNCSDEKIRLIRRDVASRLQGELCL